MLEVQLLTETAKMPTRGTKFAAGLDLYSDELGFVHTDEQNAFSTGIAVRIPDGFVGLVEPRSGLAFSYGLDTLAGVIDSDYRGEIKVLVTSCGETLRIEQGDRIAQLVIVPVSMVEPTQVAKLDASDRGTNGFGSTGK